MIKAVIFDLDGVMVESEDAHIEAEKQTFLKFGLRISSEELHNYTGTTAKVMFTDLIAKYKLMTTFEEINRQKEKLLLKFLRQDAEPTKGVLDLVKKLKKKGVQLAIASSSPKKLVDYVLDKLAVRGFFHVVLTAENVEHSKPNPEIFLKAAEKLGVKPSQCLVVEDAKLGVAAAKQAGMKCIGYRNPHSGNQDLSEADIVIDDFTKISVEEVLE